MFTPVERERVRSVLIELARGDDRITVTLSLWCVLATKWEWVAPLSG